MAGQGKINATPPVSKSLYTSS